MLELFGVPAISDHLLRLLAFFVHGFFCFLRRNPQRGQDQSIEEVPFQDVCYGARKLLRPVRSPSWVHAVSAREESGGIQAQRCHHSDVHPILGVWPSAPAPAPSLSPSHLRGSGGLTFPNQTELHSHTGGVRGDLSLGGSRTDSLHSRPSSQRQSWEERGPLLLPEFGSMLKGVPQ